MFDTLRYSRRLEEVGFDKKQAEESIRILSEIMDTNIATKIDILNLRNLTKEDINILRNEVKEDINILRNELKEDINNLNNKMRDEFTGVKKDISNLKNEIKNVESKLTIKFGLMLFVSMSLIIGVLGALIKL